MLVILLERLNTGKNRLWINRYWLGWWCFYWCTNYFGYRRPFSTNSNTYFRNSYNRGIYYYLFIKETLAYTKIITLFV